MHRQAQKVVEDLKQVEDLRRNLIAGRRLRRRVTSLIEPIADYINKPTGDRTALPRKPAAWDNEPDGTGTSLERIACQTLFE